MAKVLVEEQHLEDIADAIRGKNGTIATYRPQDMAEAIDDLEVYPEPTGTKSITENGLVSVKDYEFADVDVAGSFEPEDEGKVVQNGALVAQTSRNVTQNGTYDTTTNDEVVVNVSGGGGERFPLPIVMKWIIDYGSAWCKIITEDSIQAEYRYDRSESVISVVYGNTTMIDTYGLVLLGDFSQGGASSGNLLSDSIENYSAIILTGIYQKQRSSKYNTNMLYSPISLNKSYWTGMKDRNNDYACNVTFTDNTHVSLTGNKQVMIYGVPKQMPSNE